MVSTSRLQQLGRKLNLQRTSRAKGTKPTKINIRTIIRKSRVRKTTDKKVLTGFEAQTFAVSSSSDRFTPDDCLKLNF